MNINENLRFNMDDMIENNNILQPKQDNFNCLVAIMFYFPVLDRPK